MTLQVKLQEQSNEIDSLLLALSSLREKKKNIEDRINEEKHVEENLLHLLEEKTISFGERSLFLKELEKKSSLLDDEIENIDKKYNNLPLILNNVIDNFIKVSKGKTESMTIMFRAATLHEFWKPKTEDILTKIKLEKNNVSSIRKSQEKSIEDEEKDLMKRLKIEEKALDVTNTQISEALIVKREYEKKSQQMLFSQKFRCAQDFQQENQLKPQYNKSDQPKPLPIKSVALPTKSYDESVNRVPQKLPTQDTVDTEDQTIGSHTQILNDNISFKNKEAEDVNFSLNNSNDQMRECIVTTHTITEEEFIEDKTIGPFMFNESINEDRPWFLQHKRKRIGDNQMNAQNNFNYGDVDI